jgi:quinol monooxygenase YgiN/quercetin dioxygenase-like cupin family protein
MTSVGRYLKLTAKEGRGDALAQVLLGVADGLADTAGCELYVINRSPSEPDAVWVTELWQSQEHADAALATEEARTHMPEVMALISGTERIDVEPLGGVGYLAGATGYAIVNLEEVEDSAPKFGFGEIGEARFARPALGAVRTGLSLQRLKPGVRQAFGHHHHLDEEIYVILGGSGRIAIDDDIHEVRKLDAIRVAPESRRAFEAGPEGLELLATGAHRAGDAQILPDFWPPDA